MMPSPLNNLLSGLPVSGVIRRSCEVMLRCWADGFDVIWCSLAEGPKFVGFFLNSGVDEMLFDCFKLGNSVTE